MREGRRRGRGEEGDGEGTGTGEKENEWEADKVILNIVEILFPHKIARIYHPHAGMKITQFSPT